MNAITVKFLGGVAGDNLTGSSVLLTVRRGKETFRCLIDAGLIQCSSREFFDKNREILNELKPGYLDAIILTHPHLDHIGRLPLLVKNGFGQRGRIICTEATASLLRVMLEDSAKIQAIESESLKTKNFNGAERKNKQKNYRRDRGTRGNYDRIQSRLQKKKKTKHDNACDPLYNLEDVSATCALVKNGGFLYKTWLKLAKGISLKFYPSGHVLGGAISVIKIETKTKTTYLGFSGDLGRQDGIILPPPEIVEEKLDYWFSESTYGGEVHPERDEEIAQLLKIVARAANNKQKIIIPSFALERTQEIVYLLSYYMSINQIPKIPIYLDSPMATKITEVFAKNWDAQMFEDQSLLTFNPFSDNPFLTTIADQESSLALIQEPGPYIVIAGSGMCDAGRVREHLRVGLGQEKTIIFLVGYMARNSLGRRLKDGLPIIKMNGVEIVVKAEIIGFDSFSAHADSPFLTSYAKELATNNQLQKIFLIHGEDDGATFLKADMLEALPNNHNWLENIIIPKLGQEVIL